jgi:hypothetical protein
LSLLIVACASAQVRPPQARLPAYDAEHAVLLDDGFSGHLFETAFVPGVAGDDPHFEARVRAADSIWLLKVATVSLEGSLGNNRRYDLVFRALDTLAGTPPGGPVALTISGKDPAFHWLDRVGGAWVGHEVLLLVGRYRGIDEVALHFHGEPNTSELRARIGEIRAGSAVAERAAPGPQK